MNKELKPFKLYGENIDFIVNKGGKIETKEDLKDFMDDNLELIQLIYSYEDDLIKLGGSFDKDETVDKMLRKMYRNIKKTKGFSESYAIKKSEDGCGFDEKKYKQKNFYEMPIIEFKKLFD